MSTRDGIWSQQLFVSIIVPSYNSETKINKCLESLASLDPSTIEHEVIFVDDASTDDTVGSIMRFSESRDNWQVIQLENNSGSPSHPRNVGIRAARGLYVFFLDADDEIISGSLKEQCLQARRFDLCIVRSSLIVKTTGREPSVANRIDGFLQDESVETQIAKIVTQQSTTCSSLIKTELLWSKEIFWPEHLHMGEDTVFLLDVLTQAKRIGYVDMPGITYNKVITDTKSATQRYGARELASHLEVWNYAEAVLRPYGLSYVAIRGQAALKTVVNAIHQFYTGDIGREQFAEFTLFLEQHWKTLKTMSFPDRVWRTLCLIHVGDYDRFLENIKPRMVIAGSDLKFIEGALPKLREHYQVRIDRWGGHDSHDVKESMELLEWAEVIWCEWLLGNAVWYADRKRWNQKLIVRLHLFELTRDFGRRINQSKVDAFVAVSVPTAEDMIRTFGVERSKVRVMPNYVAIEEYKKGVTEDRVFRIGIVGILPRRKGYLEALKLLKSLRDVDTRYRLSVFGKMPAELPWVYNDVEERRYFDMCETYIRRNDLEDAVDVLGWVDTKKDLSEIGFVLSMSEFESFHVAPAEAFAAGNQAVFLPWPGVEFIYPDPYIFDSVYDMRTYILDQRSLTSFENSGCLGQEHVAALYSLDRYVDRVRELVVEL